MVLLPVSITIAYHAVGLVSPGSRREIWDWFVSMALSGRQTNHCLDEGSLRRSLFEHTGGSYPELVTRGDIKLFLPPIGMGSCISSNHIRYLTNMKVDSLSTVSEIQQKWQMRTFAWLYEFMTRYISGLFSQYQKSLKSSSSNLEDSVMGVTYSVPTSAHAARISFTGSKRQSKKHRKGEVELSFTSVKRAGPWVKLQR